MNFNEYYFIEREDLTKVQVIEKLVDQITTDLIKSFDDKLQYFFPERFTKKVGTRKERFISLRVGGNKFGMFRTDEIKLIITTTDSKTMLAKYDPEGKIIYYYNNDLAKDLQRLDTIVIFFNDEDNVENIRSRKRFRDEANKLVHKIKTGFKYDANDFKKRLFHELVHYKDDLVFSLEKFNNTRNSKANKLYNKVVREVKKLEDRNNEVNKMLQDLYYNTSVEYNAYFLESIYEFFSSYNNDPDYKEAIDKVSTDFKLFKEYYIKHFLKSFKNYDGNYQKKILKRLYDFYVKFIDMVKQGNKNEL